MSVISKHLGGKTSFNSPPVLPLRLEIYYEGFSHLIDSRPITQAGLGAIPFSEIKAYVDFLGVLDLDDRVRWLKMLVALDKAYLSVSNKTKTAVGRPDGGEGEQ